MFESIFHFPSIYSTLEECRATGSALRDLSGLRGTPLRKLSAAKTRVSDLSPLRGLPLTNAYFDGCKDLKDVSPLADCTELETVLLPEGVGGVEALRKLPKLRFVGTKWTGNADQPAPPAAKFWAEWDKTHKPAP